MAPAYTPSNDLTLYFVPQSTSTCTEAALGELGLECKKIQMSMKPEDESHMWTKSPEFLKINPNGRVPVLVHDGTPIWESSAIVLYVGELWGVDKGLWPAPGPKRGEAMKWVTWSSVSLHTAASKIHDQILGATSTPSSDPKDPKDQADDRMLDAKKEMDKFLKVLDGGLEGREYLLGEYTLVDTHIAMLVSWLRMMDVKMDAYTHIGGWADRCLARPASAKLLGN